MATLRWARASLFAAVATITGAVAHTGADGMLPSFPILLFLYALLTFACARTLASRPSVVRPIILLLGGQTFIHLGLAATAGHRHEMRMGGMQMSDEQAGPHFSMLLAHLIAAAALGLWMAYGEAALFAVLALLSATVRRTLAPQLPVVVTATGCHESRGFELPTLRARLDGRVTPRRGPPAAALLTA